MTTPDELAWIEELDRHDAHLAAVRRAIEEVDDTVVAAFRPRLDLPPVPAHLVPRLLELRDANAALQERARVVHDDIVSALDATTQAGAGVRRTEPAGEGVGGLLDRPL